METFERKISVAPNITISSVWAIPDDYRRTPDLALIIAHGAGNDMHSAFIRRVHEDLAQRGIMTVKFNFPYKEAGRKAPDRAPLLEAAWRAIIAAVSQDTELKPMELFISGKSMGGRMATHLTAEGLDCAGVILFGYPLHAPNKTEQLRAEHLARIKHPMLFFQGTRDSLCRLELLKPVLKTIPGAVELHIVEGGDHSFKVLKRSARSEEDVMNEIVDTTVEWMHRTATA
ncbi:MAG: alpha/beta family hydrolase [Pseudomonadota bacterium]